MVGAEAFLSAAKRWSKFEDSSGPALASIVDLARQLSNSESLDATAKRTYVSKQAPPIFTPILTNTLLAGPGTTIGARTTPSRCNSNSTSTSL